jgi:hypothetical protein
VSSSSSIGSFNPTSVSQQQQQHSLYLPPRSRPPRSAYRPREHTQ